MNTHYAKVILLIIIFTTVNYSTGLGQGNYCFEKLQNILNRQASLSDDVHITYRISSWQRERDSAYVEIVDIVSYGCLNQVQTNSLHLFQNDMYSIRHHLNDKIIEILRTPKRGSFFKPTQIQLLYDSILSKAIPTSCEEICRNKDDITKLSFTLSERYRSIYNISEMQIEFSPELIQSLQVFYDQPSVFEKMKIEILQMSELSNFQFDHKIYAVINDPDNVRIYFPDHKIINMTTKD